MPLIKQGCFWTLRQPTAHQAYSLITLCVKGEKCPGEALPGWESQAQVRKGENEEGRRSSTGTTSTGGRIEEKSTSRRGFNLQDFFIPAREWVRGELMSSIVSQAPLAPNPGSVREINAFNILQIYVVARVKYVP